MVEEKLDAREIAIREFNSLRGRLCSIIESANLPSKQEKALITLIKQVSYQNQAAIVQLIEYLDDDGQKFSYILNKIQETE